MPDSLTAAEDEGAGDASTALLRLVADSVPALISYYELPSLRCRFANRQYAAYHSHTPDSILGLSVREVVGDLAWALIEPQVRRCTDHGEHVKYARQQTLPSGEVRMIEVNLAPHFDPHGQRQCGTFVLINDITERWTADRTVRESEERMRKFTEATEEGIVFHHEGVITDCNEALGRMLGYGLQELLGESIFGFVSPEWRGVALEYARTRREDAYELSLLHKAGYGIPVEVVAKTLRNQQRDYRIVVVRDITARKKAQEREAFIALHDPLTQLPNRHFLMEQLTHLLPLARQRNKLVAVLLLNLDHFKSVNESLGQQAGDQLLCSVAWRLRECVREADLVARIAGDEFAVVLPDISAADSAMQVAGKLLTALSGGFRLEQVPLTITPSIGIALYPEHCASADMLLRCADAAMHHAKEGGRGNHRLYHPSMDARAVDVLRQESLLREAIATGAFALHYQPQVRLSDRSLQCLEALVRWKHPVRGMVGPDEFIHFSESRGLITPIGRWVIREACRQLKAWQDQGLPRVPVAVNLSALEFRQRDVAADIAAVLQETGLQPQYLEIELTESVLMHQSEQALTTLRTIKALGVGIAIDDFGTGYSSLAYLKRFPVDKLKIDRSFVRDIPGSLDDVAIVSAVVQMGRSLQMKTVAEGVESLEQFELLNRLGCSKAQGYLISPPLAAEPMAQWLGAYTGALPETLGAGAHPTAWGPPAANDAPSSTGS